MPAKYLDKTACASTESGLFELLVDKTIVLGNHLKFLNSVLVFLNVNLWCVFSAGRGDFKIQVDVWTCVKKMSTRPIRFLLLVL